MVLLLFLQQYPQPIPQSTVSMALVLLWQQSVLDARYCFWCFCNKLGQNECLNKTIILLRNPATWAGFPSDLTWNHHATTNIWSLNWGWPQRNLGGWNRWDTAVLSLSKQTLQQAGPFYLVSQGSRDWAKASGLSEPMQRAGTAAPFWVPSVKQVSQGKEISFTCW